eukprot:scaffold7346_cov245-Pinguiococcus_pyrenoidosus.AAC.16
MDELRKEHRTASCASQRKKQLKVPLCCVSSSVSRRDPSMQLGGGKCVGSRTSQGIDVGETSTTSFEEQKRFTRAHGVD